MTRIIISVIAILATAYAADAAVTQIDIASLPSGMYFLRAADRTVRVVKK